MVLVWYPALIPMLSDLADGLFIWIIGSVLYNGTESNPEPFPFYSDPIFKQWISRIRRIRMEYSMQVQTG